MCSVLFYHNKTWGSMVFLFYKEGLNGKLLPKFGFKMIYVFNDTNMINAGSLSNLLKLKISTW